MTPQLTYVSKDFFEKKILPYLIQDGTHLRWTRAKTSGGYGSVRYQGYVYGVHVVSYVYHHGEYPEGYDIDHDQSCPKDCANGNHLRPISHGENVHNSPLWHNQNSLKTTCINGHHFDAQNTGRDKRGNRYCKICAQIRSYRNQLDNGKISQGVFDAQIKRLIGNGP
jgi:hypothetical protein